jgi:hypothetical protein
MMNGEPSARWSEDDECFEEMDLYKRFWVWVVERLLGVGVIGVACLKAQVTAWDLGVAYGDNS